MILAAAVVVGLAAGLLRAFIAKRAYQVPALRLPGLVLFAFLPQWIAFYQSRLGAAVPDAAASVILIVSQAVLLIFAWLNRKQAGFVLLGVGLFLNLLVIAANGGWMPISPEMVRTIYPNVPESLWAVGQRLGNGKDIVLTVPETRFAILSDRFTLPSWIPYAVAFSLGDVLLAAGAIWLLWAQGGSQTNIRTAAESTPSQRTVS